MLTLVFAALVWPAACSGRAGTGEACDQERYHLPVIEELSRQWPRVDLVNYQSATAPGFHLTLALIHRYVSDRVVVLQVKG